MQDRATVTPRPHSLVKAPLDFYALFTMGKKQQHDQQVVECKAKLSKNETIYNANVHLRCCWFCPFLFACTQRVYRKVCYQWVNTHITGEWNTHAWEVISCSTNNAGGWMTEGKRKIGGKPKFNPPEHIQRHPHSNTSSYGRANEREGKSKR